ncbi:uncharacterized protein METZ01_LOCUS308096, partial [marine metagenome]|jgi:uncharacterized membrane protein|tara:strand:- start:915 stop:1253 length:339 start_codon:yes stop_codon:yes gene_type:complete
VGNHPFHDRDDRGQILPFTALLLVLAAGLAVLIVELGQIAVDRAQARNAADAAALAAAASPGRARAQAVRLAGANGARIVSFDEPPGEVVVVVVVGRARATARAQTIRTFAR